MEPEERCAQRRSHALFGTSIHPVPKLSYRRRCEIQIDQRSFHQSVISEIHGRGKVGLDESGVGTLEIQGCVVVRRCFVIAQTELSQTAVTARQSARQQRIAREIGGRGLVALAVPCGVDPFSSVSSQSISRVVRQECLRRLLP